MPKKVSRKTRAKALKLDPSFLFALPTRGGFAAEEAPQPILPEPEVEKECFQHTFDDDFVLDNEENEWDEYEFDSEVQYWDVEESLREFDWCGGVSK